jgi:hypothetical protein
VNCPSSPGFGGINTSNALDDRYPEPARSECDVDPDEPGAYELAVDKATLSEWNQCQKPPENRAVTIAVINEFPSGASGDITILGLATFYIAGWCEPSDKDCPADGAVYGYLLADVALAPPEDVLLGVSDNPFAPRVETLVE